MREIGLHEEKWAECVQSPRPEARLRADLERLEKAEFLGLPTTYIGRTRVLGARPQAIYEEALANAVSGADEGGVSPLVYWLVTGCLGFFCVFFGRVRLKPVMRSP
jgi:predicted DsbA family dithiol-disulfide isomerase